MSRNAFPLKTIGARVIGIVVVLALVGFYPLYLTALHDMCGVIQGKVVRYL